MKLAFVIIASCTIDHRVVRPWYRMGSSVTTEDTCLARSVGVAALSAGVSLIGAGSLVAVRMIRTRTYYDVSCLSEIL